MNGQGYYSVTIRELPIGSSPCQYEFEEQVSIYSDPFEPCNTGTPDLFIIPTVFTDNPTIVYGIPPRDLTSGGFTPVVTGGVKDFIGVQITATHMSGQSFDVLADKVAIGEKQKHRINTKGWPKGYYIFEITTKKANSSNCRIPKGRAKGIKIK